jgi:hypothetical protein
MAEITIAIEKQLKKETDRIMNNASPSAIADTIYLLKRELYRYRGY